MDIFVLQHKYDLECEERALERDKAICAQKQAVEIQRLKSIVKLCEAGLQPYIAGERVTAVTAK